MLENLSVPRWSVFTEILLRLLRKWFSLKSQRYRRFNVYYHLIVYSYRKWWYHDRILNFIVEINCQVINFIFSSSIITRLTVPYFFPCSDIKCRHLVSFYAHWCYKNNEHIKPMLLYGSFFFKTLSFFSIPILYKYININDNGKHLYW